MNQKTIIAILVVVVIILFGTTVYFATISNTSQLVPTTVTQQPTSPAPIAQQSETVQPTKNQDPVNPTPDVKNLFTNPNGKYSFTTPSTWKVSINQYNNDNSLFGPDANSSSGLGGVEIFDNQSSVDKFLESVDAQYLKKTKITVDGVSGIRTHYKGFPVSGEQVVLLKNGKIYNIYVNSEKAEDIKLLEQIFTTFKFTE